MREWRNCAAVFARGVRVHAAFVTILAGAGAVQAQQVSVTEQGDASYAIPIEVPPGIAGHEPKLALQYSRGAAGALALGWTIGGVSTITRCGSTIATDGVRRGVTYAGSDRFCLDGARLIQTTPDGEPVAGQSGYGSSGSEYRTERESHSRIRAYGGSPAAGPSYFKVWTKSGLTYHYGGVSSARIATFGLPTDVTTTWAVNKITDAAGNFIDFEYDNGTSTFAGGPGREWVLARVRYTGNGSQAPNNRVEFVYTNSRPDGSEAYHEGSRTVVTKRLSHVSTFIKTDAGDREVTRLKLTHQLSSRTGRSLLASAQICGGAGMSKCRPAVSFTYSEGSTITFQPHSLSSHSLARLDSSGYPLRGVYQGDFNGDGREDLLVWDHAPANNHVLLSRGDGTFSIVTDPVPGNPLLGHSRGCVTSRVADFNLDGIADLLLIQGTDLGAACDGVPRASQVYLGTGAGKFGSGIQISRDGGAPIYLAQVDPSAPPETDPSSEPYGGRSFNLVDINADGRLDLVFTVTPRGTIEHRHSNCATTELTCIFLGTSTTGRFQKVATNLAQKNLFSHSGSRLMEKNLPAYQSDRLYIGDLNGDGLADVLLRDTGKMFLGTAIAGTFAEKAAAVPCSAGAEVLDINGDGRWDIACMDFQESGPFKAYASKGNGVFEFRSTVGSWAGGCTLNPTRGHWASHGEDTVCVPWDRTWVNNIAADLDGDGISDVLQLGKRAYAYAPNKYNEFLRGLPDGSFELIQTGLETKPINMQHRTALIGDFTGNGRLEILSYSHNDAENTLYIRDTSPADLLVRVKTVGNVEAIIQYKPLSDANVYKRSAGAEYPVVDLVANNWVVASVRTPNGLGGHIATDYEYRGQRADLLGRGYLGFGRIDTTKPAADGTLMTTATDYSQTFPYVGLPTRSRVMREAGGDQSWVKVVKNTYETACPRTASPKIYQVAWTQTIEESRDLNGAPISYTETQRSGFNCYGDPATIDVTTKRNESAVEMYTKTTANVYFNDTSGENWILARLSGATQTNTTPATVFPPPTAGGSTSGDAPTLQVSVAPASVMPGQSFTRTWTSTNATSVSVNCTAAAGGYTETTTKALANGADTVSAIAAWVNKPSTCVWTATGPRGAKTVTHEMVTVPPPPTLTVALTPHPLLAGSSFQTKWTTTYATSVSRVCTASGSGYTVDGTLGSVSGSSSATAKAAWVGYPSNCVWTAVGPSGTKTVSYKMTTYAKPAINVSHPAHFERYGGTSSWKLPIDISTTYASAVQGLCRNRAITSKTKGVSPGIVNGRYLLPVDATWDGNWDCTWTATGSGGSAIKTTSVLIMAPISSFAAPALGQEAGLPSGGEVGVQIAPAATSEEGDADE